MVGKSVFIFIAIGFSQCNTQDDWRKTMFQEMRREIGFHPNYGITLIITDANDNSENKFRMLKN